MEPMSKNGESYEEVNGTGDDVLCRIIEDLDQAQNQNTEFLLAKSSEENQLVLSENSKYGKQLRNLPPLELYHVVNYAIITESDLEMEYEGQQGNSKKGLRRITPHRIRRNMVKPKIEAYCHYYEAEKEFSFELIKRIRVI